MPQPTDGRSAVTERQCPYCEEKIVGTPATYAQHIKHVHPDKAKAKKQKQTEHTVAYCPVCGTHIAGVAIAMNVAERLKN